MPRGLVSAALPTCGDAKPRTGTRQQQAHHRTLVRTAIGLPTPARNLPGSLDEYSMATSRYQTITLPASAYTESAGSVLLEPRSQKIALIYFPPTQEWFLPKGRRNILESRLDAALRESWEETGVRGLEMAAIDLLARCTVPAPVDAGLPAATEQAATQSELGRNISAVDPQDDGTTMFRGVRGEPFMVQIREPKEPVGLRSDVGGCGTKFIWWYLTLCPGVDVDTWDQDTLHGEEGFQSAFFEISEAVEKLTFEDDKKVVKEASRVWSHTKHNENMSAKKYKTGNEV